jgi:hypothetical protein
MAACAVLTASTIAAKNSSPFISVFIFSSMQE